MPAADRDMADLDPPVAERIYKRVKWLSGNFDSITPEPLEGPWKGKYKFRIGDYRVIYTVNRDESDGSHGSASPRSVPKTLMRFCGRSAIA